MRLTPALSLSLLLTTFVGFTAPAGAMKARLAMIAEQQKQKEQEALTKSTFTIAPTLTANKAVKEALEKQDFTAALKEAEAILTGGGVAIPPATLNKVQGGGTTAADLEQHFNDILKITGNTNIKDGVTDLEAAHVKAAKEATEAQKKLQDLHTLIGGKDLVDTQKNTQDLLTKSSIGIKIPDLTASVTLLHDSFQTLANWVDNTAKSIKQAKDNMDKADALGGDPAHTFLARAKDMRQELSDQADLITETQKAIGGKKASLLDNAQDLQQMLLDQMFDLLIKPYRARGDAAENDVVDGNPITKGEIETAQKQFIPFIEVIRAQYETSGSTLPDIDKAPADYPTATVLADAIRASGPLSLKEMLDIQEILLS